MKKQILTIILFFLVNPYVYAEDFSLRLSNAALERTQHRVIYNGHYRKINYPNGDVPEFFGVCTDVIIRSFRQVGIDLQKDVHEDMRENFDAYPKLWGLTKTDTNIDHRRVPNLQTFFSRKGIALAISDKPDDYQTGDLVTWMLSGNRPHIGIVVARWSAEGTPMIVHNIGWGPKLGDMLFDYPITGHYRY